MEPKAFRCKQWKAFGIEQYLRRMREHFTVKGKWTKEVLADAEKEGLHGNWQMESPSKGELELVKRCSDLSVSAKLMRPASYEGR